MSSHPGADKRIGRNLAYHRSLHNRTQADLAHSIGLDRSVLAGIETGRRPLRFSEAILLHERERITLDNLADGVPIGF